ncbi:hypothetical protein [Streptomyces fuscichromogenes]|uniref:Uncharacterized protein n=1 Tax=Streptomyces fuscichromogenes TaxID=1324013 RepID=A0A917XMV1_9ACTN|nr:hypothetical protein [Streptomyces fuscichromogenes]GGN40188.1 hypothetical protein GCM10011578_087460 [Streptomyces fuscichromogenes]
MPTPSASGAPNDLTTLEPIRVVRIRNTDALAQLLDDIRQDQDYRGHEGAAVVIGVAAAAVVGFGCSLLITRPAQDTQDTQDTQGSQADPAVPSARASAASSAVGAVGV